MPSSKRFPNASTQRASVAGCGQILPPLPAFQTEEQLRQKHVPLGVSVVFVTPQSALKISRLYQHVYRVDNCVVYTGGYRYHLGESACRA